MKKLLAIIGVVCGVLYYQHTKAATFATMPNQANGKIVLTDEVCSYNGKTYSNINRAYNYGSAGYTQEGCWAVEDETIVIYWIESEKRMRYPIQNFTLAPAYKKGNSNRGFNY